MADLQIVSTLFLFGLIWFVQLLHYPLFSIVGDSPTFYSEHQRRTSWIVLPIITLELGSAKTLFFLRQSITDQIGLVFIIGTWLSTILLQMPCHRSLSSGYSIDTIKRLVRTKTGYERFCGPSEELFSWYFSYHLLFSRKI